MDPHTHSNRSDLPLESGESDEGVNYLRRLKGARSQAAPASATDNSAGEASAGTAVANAPAFAPSSTFEERRQTPRLRCSGSVEFRAEGNEVRMLGSLTDISLHGCYVAMNTTFPVGTKVDLVLESMGIRSETAGTVRATYPALGMGIAFADIEPAQLLQLQQLLAALPSRNHIFKVGAAHDVDSESMRGLLASVDAKAFLEEIAQFLQKNPGLSRAEFCQIAKRFVAPEIPPPGT